MILSLIPVDTGGQLSVRGGCSKYCRVFNSIPQLLPARYQEKHHPEVKTKNVSRQCQMSFRDKIKSAVILPESLNLIPIFLSPEGNCKIRSQKEDMEQKIFHFEDQGSVHLTTAAPKQVFKCYWAKILWVFLFSVNPAF